jgi:hypothetical protein
MPDCEFTTLVSMNENQNIIILRGMLWNTK